MAKKQEPQKEKILSAVSVFKKFDTSLPLDALQMDEIAETDAKARYATVEFSGREAEDGRVRIHALFGRPAAPVKAPAILLLDDAGKAPDRELLTYFVEKGYAVLALDYSGKKTADEEEREEGETCEERRTVYPASLSFADFATAEGRYDLEGRSVERSCWFEWTYTALYAVEYLRAREDIGKIGVVGIRAGGEIAWKVMLSPHISCGIPVNAAGWLSSRGTDKFVDNAAINLTGDRHRYIAGIESQSYAPFVKSPVLMLCACNDYGFDYDRAYDTYSRIGGGDGEMRNAVAYSSDSGSCIGPDGLKDLDLFLERNLKGRAIYIPDALGIAVGEDGGDLVVTATGDKEGLVEEMGVFYAEAGAHTKSVFREWLCVHKDNAVKNHEITCRVTPFAGAEYAYFYAYARYINGFFTVSKIVAKKLTRQGREAKNRVIFSGTALDTFSVADHEEYSVGGIFLEKESVPTLKRGYGGILGAYSVGGIKTYKISSPRYVAETGAALKFDAYSQKTDKLCISVDIAGNEGEAERYSCFVPVKGGGKWKRIVLEAKDFKNERYGKPLESFSLGSALVFDGLNEDGEVLVTNILWL